jgi:hypothetical protein
MLIPRNKRCLALVLLCAAGAAPAEDKRVPDKDLVPWADSRVRDWRPRPAERRFDEIGWAKDIRSARKMAREHSRPVFLFTMDGRINVGRC